MIPFALPPAIASGFIRFIPYIIVFALAFASGFGAHKIYSDRRMAEMERAHADVERNLTEEISRYERNIAAAQAMVREVEGKLQSQVDDARRINEEAAARISQQAREVVRLRVDRDRLHDDLSAYASASAAGHADSVSACQARAGALGSLVAEGAELLTEGSGLFAACAEAHDRRAAEVSAILSAWPGK